jgi:hypothetical protein
MKLRDLFEDEEPLIIELIKQKRGAGRRIFVVPAGTHSRYYLDGIRETRVGQGPLGQHGPAWAMTFTKNSKHFGNLSTIERTIRASEADERWSLVSVPAEREGEPAELQLVHE